MQFVAHTRTTYTCIKACGPESRAFSRSDYPQITHIYIRNTIHNAWNWFNIHRWCRSVAALNHLMLSHTNTRKSVHTVCMMMTGWRFSLRGMFNTWIDICHMRIHCPAGFTCHTLHLTNLAYHHSIWPSLVYTHQFFYVSSEPGAYRVCL